MSEIDKKFLAVVSNRQEQIRRNLPSGPGFERDFELVAFDNPMSLINNPPRGHQLHGMILDLGTFLNHSRRDREEFRRILSKSFPSFEYDGQKTCEHNSPQQVQYSARFEKFLAEVRNFQARGLRASPRKQIFVPTTLSSQDGENFSKTSLKTVTYDLSEGGCFVVTPVEVPAGSEIFLKFPNLTQALRCSVAWNCSWGSTFNQLPGLGLRFEDYESVEFEGAAGQAMKEYLSMADILNF